jgi:hypothetical protein
MRQYEKERKKRKKRKRKDDRMLFRSNLTLSNLIFCIQCKWTGKVVFERTEKNGNRKGVVDTSFHLCPCKNYEGRWINAQQ